MSRLNAKPLPTKISPLVKWSGSKGFFVKELYSLLPDLRGKRVFEPFLGGGSMLFCYDVASVVYASDIIPVLIDLFKTVKDNPEVVIEEYSSRWHQQQKNVKFYYEVRSRFNSNGLKDLHDFLFLMRLCYNGLPRFNSKGEFNTSLHIGRAGINPSTFKDVVFLWHKRVANVTFSAADYRESLSSANHGDFVFLDPPYFSTHGQYYPAAASFDFSDLKLVLEGLNSRGVSWMLTLDADFDLKTNHLLSGVYKVRKETSKHSSSFRRLAGQSSGKFGNTIYTNYQIKHKEILF